MRYFPIEGSTWARTVALVALVVIVFASLTLADVQFTEPAAGANLTAGQIDVQWKESGIKPLISELTQYTLSLMVGGNDLDDMQPVVTFESAGSYSSGFSAQGTIPEGIAAEIPNGFFFRMTSTKQAGGVLINYSDRFSILGLTGDTALKIKQAALALNSDIAGPPVVGENVSSTTSSGMTVSLTGPKVPTRTHFTSIEASHESSAGLTASPDDDNTSSGLSKGAIAAIVVAVTLAITAASVALAWHLWARRRKRQNEIREVAPGTIFHHKPASELSAEDFVSPVSPGNITSSKLFFAHTSELSSENVVYEAGSGQRRPKLELDTVVVRYELEGSQPVTPCEEKKDFNV